jgi:hypothetical protein
LGKLRAEQFFFYPLLYALTTEGRRAQRGRAIARSSKKENFIQPRNISNVAIIGKINKTKKIYPHNFLPLKKKNILDSSINDSTKPAIIGKFCN